MANVPGTFYTAETQRKGATPVSPPNADDDPQGPIGGATVPPVAKRYTSQAIMIADQNNQLEGYLYFDGTDNWWYNGGTSGTIADYVAFGSYGVIFPDGIVQYGGVTQIVNDIDLDTNWIWRLSNIIYNKPTSTLFSIPPAASGYTRIDLIVGDNSNDIYRVAGTEVLLPDAAIPPNVPVDTIGLILVFVTDVGVVDFTEFALSSFVRFDINDQGLNEVQRQNARTNIQALSKDTNDSRTGELTQNGKTLININSGGNGGVSISFPDTVCTFPSTTYGLLMRGRTSASLVDYLIQLMSASNFQTFAIRNRGDVYFDHYMNGSSYVGVSFKRSGVELFKSAYGTGQNMDIDNHNMPSWKFFSRVTAANKSSVPQELLRRDEQRLYYPITITTAGAINDQAITAGIFNYRFTACTSLTGIQALDIGTKITIQNDNTVNMDIAHQSASSTAANRFNLIGGATLVVPTKGKAEFMYCTGSRWELLSKNF